MWKKKYIKMVPLDPKTNVAVMLTAPDYNLSEAKITQIEVSMACHQVILANEIGLVSDNEADPAESTPDTDILPPEQTADLDSVLHLIEDFNLNGPANQQVDINEEDRVQGTPESDLLSWHHQLAHLPFNNIKAMAQNGLLPARLQHARTPLCSSCLYGKATRQPRRTRALVNTRQVPSITRPRACVAVDQAESPVQGLIAQLKGIPTKKCYKCATVFVDLYSNLGYVYLQQLMAANEMIKAKEAFERYAKNYGILIQNYHADNS